MDIKNINKILRREDAIWNLLGCIKENITELLSEVDEDGWISINHTTIEEIQHCIRNFYESTSKELEVGQRVLITSETEYMIENSSGESYPSEELCMPGKIGKIIFIKNDGYKPYVEVQFRKKWSRFRLDKPLPFIILK